MKRYFNLMGLIIIISGCSRQLTPTQSKYTKINSTQFIEETYKDKDGVITDDERQEITDKGCAPVYGEILHASLKTLLDDLSITTSDVFYDLGSGIGKVTIQAYLDYPFKKVVGIELSPTRCKHAFDAKKIDNNTLISRFAFDGEKLKLLDEQEIILSDKDLVISD
ncbi:MAG: phenylalanine--tRNA ligase beta subunit-related protein, partial [Candidatus Babeliales bacterium]|nr:phenylalanine--tRNA ligase beta subunit-related protein [Candidatus Babeliales bacterium]